MQTSHKTNKSICVIAQDEQKTLSKAQKMFNSLIKQINKRRDLLGEWERVTPVFSQHHREQYLPTEEAFDKARINLVYCLDEAYVKKGLTATDRKKIESIIIEMSAELLEIDESLKAIYNKYTERDYDREMADNLARDIDQMTEILERQLDIDLSALDKEGIKSPSELIERVLEQTLRQGADQNRDELAQLPPWPEHELHARKKTTRQQKREECARLEQEQMKLSVREIYRKLAKALHPDREPDELERARKTALMQRTNEAYKKNNLLQLLELQLELEHIDQAALGEFSEERLGRYNLLLKEQVRELDMEVSCVERSFQYRYGFNALFSLSPQKVLPLSLKRTQELLEATAMIENDLIMLCDVKNLKAWLKFYKITSMRG